MLDRADGEADDETAANSLLCTQLSVGNDRITRVIENETGRMNSILLKTHLVRMSKLYRLLQAMLRLYTLYFLLFT